MAKPPDSTKFLQLLRKQELQGLLNFIESHKIKRPKFLEKFVATLNTEDELVETWKMIFDTSAVCLAVVLGQAENSEITPQTALDALYMFLHFTQISFSVLTEAPEDFLHAAMFFHEMIVYLPEEKDDLKNKIAALCEIFWKNGIPAKDALIINATIYLLKRSLIEKPIKTDIKRVWALRDSLKVVMEKSDALKQELIGLLKSCAVSPYYLMSPDGRKFISFVFCLDSTLVKGFHEAVKDKIPTCSLKQCASYGEIYYNSWIESGDEGSEELKKELEDKIQDIMYHAMRLPRGGILPHLRKFLSVFHVKRDDTRVLKMLWMLYCPILWRFLKDHRGYVRANTAYLFLDVFPLEDPDLLIVESEANLHRQTLLIKELLLDDCPWTRCVAIEGVCNILAFQWELIPKDMINVYLRTITEDLSRDISYTGVRMSVIKGMKALLNNHFVVEVLKTILSRISWLFQDTSEKVRMAFCRLLLEVKKNRAIKYWEIVPVDELLSRLEMDKPRVAKLIVELTFNSYIPVQQPEISWLVRCSELIRGNRNASQVFFLHAPSFLGLKLTAKFICFIYKTMELFIDRRIRIEAATRGGSKKTKDVMEDADPEVEEFMKTLEHEKDTTIISGIFDAAYVMLKMILSELQLEENKKAYKHLLARIARHMPPLLKYYAEEKGCWIPVYLTCSHVSTSIMPDFPKMCFNKLTTVTGEDEYDTLLSCLCYLGKTADILYPIQESLQGEIEQILGRPKAKKARRKTRSTEVVFEPLQAALFVDSLVRHRATAFIVKDQHLEQLKEIVNYMASLQEAIIAVKTTLNGEQRQQFLVKTFSTIVTTAVLLHVDKHLNADVFVREQLKWLVNTFIPSKPEPAPTNSRISRSSTRNMSIADRCETEFWNKLGLEIFKEMLEVSKVAVAFKMCDFPASDYLLFTKQIVHSEYGPNLMNQCIQVVRSLSLFCNLVSPILELKKQNQAFIPEAFSEIIQVLRDEDFHKQLPLNGKSEMKSLRLLLVSQSEINLDLPNDMNTLMSTLLDGILHGVIPAIENEEEDEEIILPLPSMNLISTVTGPITILKLFLQFIQSYVKGKDVLRCSAVSLITLRTLGPLTKTAKMKMRLPTQELLSILENKATAFASKVTSEQEKNSVTQMQSWIQDIANLFKENSSGQSVCTDATSNTVPMEE